MGVALRVAFVAALLALPARAEIDESRRFVFEGKQRQYFFFAPDNTCEPDAAPAPVVILHHGTGGDGHDLIGLWRDLARKERVVLIAPTGTGPYGWIVPQDGPELHRAIVEQVARECPLDMRRLYLLGFSNGGDQAFYVGIAESRYFAAAAIVCASLRPRQFPMLDLAPRRIPLFYLAAEDDRAYPMKEAAATRAALKQRKWPLEYQVVTGAHRYAPDFTARAWQFLRKQKLAADPQFVPLSEQWLAFALR